MINERKIKIPNEQTLIFLKLARIGQETANQIENEELDNIASGEIKRFFDLKFLNKSMLCEYFLQGFVPEIKKKFENPSPTRKIKEGFIETKPTWTNEWQYRYIEVGKMYFEKYYKQKIEPLLK